MIMQVWLWVVSGILWVLVIGLAGLGMWKLLNAMKLLHLAGLNMFVRMGEELKSKIHKVGEGVSAQKEHVRGTEEFQEEVTEEEVEELSSKIDNLLKKVYASGGEKGAIGNIEEIWASRDIALAAAFFAMASVVAGVSAVIIALFGG